MDKNVDRLPTPYELFVERRDAILAKMAPLVDTAARHAAAQADLLFFEYLGKLSDKADLDEWDPEVFAQACRLSLASRCGGSLPGFGSYDKPGASWLLRRLLSEHERLAAASLPAEAAPDA